MPLPSPQVALVYNPAAGAATGGAEAREALRALYGDILVYETSAHEDADACARKALAEGAELIVAAGGDGTVSLVASALVGTGARLGILPRGTSNSIASALGIPDDLKGAIDVLRAGHHHAVDTAVANGRTMVLHASVGLHADTIANTTREAKNRWGIFAYVADGLAHLAGLEPFAVEIETESRVVRCRASNVMVANLAPPKTVLAQGPAVVAGDDGALSVTIVAAESLVEAVATGVHLYRSALREEAATRDNVGFLRARRVRIDTTPEQALLVDGEPAGKGRLVVTCLPRSLHVVVPRDVQVEAAPAGPETKLAGLPELEVEAPRRKTT